MQIQIPDEKYQQLTLVAQAAGYDDVSTFINSLVDGALADEPIEDPRGPLTEEQLRESVARLKRADASIDSGRGITVEDAFQSIAEKHGFNLPL